MNKPTHFAPDVAYSEKRDRIVSLLFNSFSPSNNFFELHKMIMQAGLIMTRELQPPPVAEREPVNHRHAGENAGSVGVPATAGKRLPLSHKKRRYNKSFLGPKLGSKKDLRSKWG